MSEIKVVPCPQVPDEWIAVGEKLAKRGYLTKDSGRDDEIALNVAGAFWDLHLTQANNPEPVEQAAPPRPQDAETELMQALADFVMGYQIDSPTDSHHRSWNEGVAVAASQFLDPQDNRPVIEALKKYAAPAAIEQARPQTPANVASMTQNRGVDSRIDMAESGGQVLYVAPDFDAPMELKHAAEPAPERTQSKLRNERGSDERDKSCTVPTAS